MRGMSRSTRTRRRCERGGKVVRGADFRSWAVGAEPRLPKQNTTHAAFPPIHHTSSRPNPFHRPALFADLGPRLARLAPADPPSVAAAPCKGPEHRCGLCGHLLAPCPAPALAAPLPQQRARDFAGACWGAGASPCPASAPNCQCGPRQRRGAPAPAPGPGLLAVLEAEKKKGGGGGSSQGGTKRGRKGRGGACAGRGGG